MEDTVRVLNYPIARSPQAVASYITFSVPLRLCCDVAGVRRRDSECSGASSRSHLHNARIYTVDSRNSVAAAVAIPGDRIIRARKERRHSCARGALDPHARLARRDNRPGLSRCPWTRRRLGASLQDVDLRGTSSYEEVVGRVRRRLASARPGEWIIGRGWDQNDWAEKVFPAHDLLSAASPDNPIYLTRVDGHAGLANRTAMEIAGLSGRDRSAWWTDHARTNGQPTGVLIDGAQALVTSKIPRWDASSSRIRSSSPTSSFAEWASRRCSSRRGC